MVLARATMQREREMRRIAQRRQNVPRRGNEDGNQRATEGMEALPRSGGEKLARYEEVDQADSRWENHSNQALEQQACAKIGSQYDGPEPRMSFLLVEGSQERPNRQGDRESLHHVRDQDPSEEK